MNLAHELGHMVMHRLPEPDMEDHANKFAINSGRNPLVILAARSVLE